MSSKRETAAPVTGREVPCDLCGSSDFEVVGTRDRRGRPLTTVVCRRCGLVSHQRMPSEDELEQYYARSYRKDYQGATTPAAFRVVRAWRRGWDVYQLLRHYLEPGLRVLEIGAGIGCTVKIFEEAGCDATGIEPGTGFHAFSQNRLLARVENEGLYDLPSRPAYDLVLLIHVLEHVRSPKRALEKIHSVLDSGGLLYVECPNVAAPHAAPGKSFHFAHIHNFTPATLRMLAGACGFDVAEQLSRDGDRNVMLVLRKTETRQLALDPMSYAQTMSGLRRYTVLSYHLRRAYLMDRARGVALSLSDRVFAKKRLARIEARCVAAARSFRECGVEAGERSRVKIAP